MPISIDETSFDNIVSLLNHLSTEFEEKEKTVVKISAPEGLNKDELAELLAYVIGARKVALQISLVGPASNILTAQNQVLADAYKVAKRNVLSQKLMDELALPPMQSQQVEKKLRKAKLDLVKGVGVGSIQVQQQQQQQQQQATVSKTTALKPRVNRERVYLELAIKAPDDNNPLGELITRDNIEAQLRDFADKIHPGKQINLEQLWDKLVGDGALKVANKHRFVSVERGAMEVIIRNYSEFCYGLVFDNLPSGLYLEKQADRKQILRYNTGAQYQWVTNPLTLTLAEPVEPLGSHQQFILQLLAGKALSPEYITSALEGNNSEFKKAYPNSKNYTKYFSELTGGKPKKQKKAFDFFLSELVGTEKARLINTQINEYNFSDQHIQGLISLLINNGDKGISQFLQQMSLLKTKELFPVFDTVFLKNNPNYAPLLTERGLKNLEKMASLTGPELTWWESLINEHHKSGFSADFNELFEAYSYFLAELGKLNLKQLPLVCPIKPIGHMKPALDRALIILRNASDREEQLSCLDGLDYGPYGAYYASQYGDYKLVAGEMGIRPDKQSKQPLSYSFQSSHDFYLDGMYLPDEIDVTIEELYYRFIGQQDCSISLDDCKKIVPLVHYLSDSKQTKRMLLCGIALLITSPNALRINNPVAEVSAFLNSIPQEVLEQVNLMQLKNFDPKFMPTPAELEKMVVFLSESDEQVPISQKLNATLNLLPRYEDKVYLLLDNIKERKKMQKQGNHAIDQISWWDLRLLIENSNLYSLIIGNEDRGIKPLFEDGPTQGEAMQHFVVVLSLISGPLLVNDIQAMVALFGRIPTNQRDILLSILADIDVSRSTSLPSVEMLEHIQFNLFENRDVLLAMEDGMLKATILGIVERNLPNTKIGKEPVAQSFTGLVDVFKDLFKNINMDVQFEQIINEQVPKLPNLFQSPVKNLLRSGTEKLRTVFGQFKEELEVDPPDIDRILTKFELLNNEVKTILDKVGMSQLMTLIILSRPVEQREKLEKFRDEKNLLALLKEDFEFNFSAKLNKAVNKLQTNNNRINSFLLNLLGELSTQSSIKQELIQFSERFNQINGLINLLIQLRNYNEKDFRETLLLIEENLHQFIPEKIEQMTQLISYMLTAPKVPINNQMRMVFSLLRENNGASPDQVQSAFEQVKLLTEHSQLLSIEAYILLLKASLSNTLKKPEPFPLQQMLALQSIQGIDEEQARELFSRFIRVVERMPGGANVDLNEFIRYTIDVINTKTKDTPTTVPFVMSLLKKCMDSHPQELPIYIELLANLPKEEAIREKWMSIITRAALERRVTLSELKLLQEGLKKHAVSLEAIANLFSYQPYPHLDKLLPQLVKEKEALERFISGFDKDPKSARAPVIKNDQIIRTTEAILEAQFETSQIHDVVVGIKGILENRNLTSQQQYDLAQQIVYINALGKDFQLIIEGKTYPKLIDATRDELREAFDKMREQLHQPHLNEEEIRTIHLKLIALMREMFFRSTGKLPYTTQLITLLLSLDNPDNLLMEINTGEGKGITTALLAALQWVNSNGETINVCTANMGLVDQDYTEKGSVNFFNCMGIPSAIVRSDSPAGTYKIGGINYSSVSNLSLYRSRAKLEGEVLTKKVNGKKAATHLILDESDYVTLEDKTLFNLAMGAEGGGDSQHNPFAWIYPLVNEFIEGREFKNIDPKKGEIWSSIRDIKELRDFLGKHADSVENRKLLASLTDNKFDKWLNAACEAKRRIIGTHFIIQEEKREEETVYVAVPLINSNPQKGAVFSDGVQQFIHARLQKEEKKGRRFTMDAEMLFVATESAKDFIDSHMEDGGRIMGISGTAGTPQELMEQQAKFGVKAISVPPHKKNQRTELATKVTKTSSSQLGEIKKTYKNLIKQDAKETQPVLMICKDINQARELHNQLSNPSLFKGKTVQLITGEESDEERQEKMENAGKPNVLTISTSLLGRGTDIDPHHKKGLFVIQAYFDLERNTRQIIGRAARNGKLGQYIAIYDQNGIPHRYEFGSLLRMTPAKREIALKKIQKIMNEEAAVERHYIQEVALIQQVAMKQFDDWQGFLQLLHKQPEHKDLNKSLLLMREELITNLTAQWKRILDESDPKKEYSNPYVRRDRKGKLITKGLDEALKTFEEEAARIWAETRSHLVQKTENKLDDSVNQLRSDYMSRMEFDEQLKARKLSLLDEKKQNIQKQQLAERRVESALDTSAAVLRFGGTDGDTEEMKQRSAWFQLKLIQKNFNHVIQRTSLNHLKKESLSQDMAANNESLVNTFHEFANAFWQFEAGLVNAPLTVKNRMQPLVIEFLATYEQSKPLLDRVNDENIPILSEKMKGLKDLYLDKVVNDLANNLNKTLSWAKDTGGIFYWMERTLVKKAAQEIMEAVDALNSATPEKKATKIKELYQLLQKHQAKLEGLWLPSFGHQNTRDLIKSSIRAFDDIAHVADLPPNFREECQEKAIVDVYLEEFSSLISQSHVKIMQQYPIKDTSNKAKVARAQWEEITKEIAIIRQNNNSLYVFSEIDRYLADYKESHQVSSIFKHLQDLVHGVRQKSSLIRENHTGLMDKSHYFLSKAEQIKEILLGREGANNVQEVIIKQGHTGFSEYFDLIVKGGGNNELFPKFTHYNSQLQSLEEQLAAKIEEKRKLTESYHKIGNYINQENEVGAYLILRSLPTLPKPFKDAAEKINTLLELSEGHDVLKDHALLSPETKGHINNRTLVAALTKDKEFAMLKDCRDQGTTSLFKDYFDTLNTLNKDVEVLETKQATLIDSQLQKERDKQVRSQKTGLINFVAKGINSIGSAITKIQNESNEEALWKAREAVATHRASFAKLQESKLDEFDARAKSALKEQLTDSINELRGELSSYRAETAGAMSTHDAQIKFLETTIEEEKRKSSLMMRRFDSFDDLLSYEASLKKMPKVVIQPEAEPRVGQEMPMPENHDHAPQPPV